MKSVRIVVCGFLLASAVQAQPTPAPARERARTYLMVRIAEKLQLSDEKALAVSALIRKSDERRQQLVTDRKNLEEKLRGALSRGESAAAELPELIAQGSDIDRQLALLPEEMFHEAQKILTVEQQGRLLLFRRELQHEVRHAIHKRFGPRDAPRPTNSGHSPTPASN